MNRKLLLLVSLATSPLCADLLSPTYVVRSQGSDAARKLAGLSDKVHLDQENRYVNFDATLEYSRSFDQNKIARSLFGTDLVNCNQILIQGSAITGAERNANAWFADYFYLAPDYNSYFCITPHISNFMADLDLYVGFDDIAKGLYLRLHGPLTHTTWNLNFQEQCDIQTTGSYNHGYFDHDIMLNNQLLGTFGQFAQGQTPLNTTGTTAQPTIGVQFLPLQYAKIDSCSHSRTGFAELRMELGWDFAQNDDYHFGLNAQVAAPTGGRTYALLAFDPTIGNRHHWETGAGLTAHYTFWRAQGEEKHAGFYLDLSLTHLNNAREQRTFDLNGRPNSRYMLAMQMGNPVSFLTASTDPAGAAPAPVTPNSQFQSLFSPVANLTTLDLYVRTGVQADLAVMFNYSGENCSFDLGYNLWARSSEKFSHTDIDACCPSLCNGSVNQWALKGDAHVYGFISATSGTLATGEPVALSATECGATIHGGTNSATSGGTTSCPGVSINTNCGVDNGAYAFASQGAGATHSLLFDPTQPTTVGNQVQTSLQPAYINCCDINLQSTRGLSNKVFAHFNYTWDKESWTPYLGIGGFAEFGQSQSDCDPCATPVILDCTTPCDNTSCCTTDCTESFKCAVSQWGVWIKGGMTFGESYERPRNTNNGRMYNNNKPMRNERIK